MDPENHWLVEENTLPGGQDVRVYVSFWECIDPWLVWNWCCQRSFGTACDAHKESSNPLQSMAELLCKGFGTYMERKLNVCQEAHIGQGCGSPQI